MRKCPVCRTDLAPVDYEGFRIWQCTNCGGHLLPLPRLESIKRVDRKPQEELKAEASADFAASSPGILKCPRCRLSMQKRRAELPVLELHTDVCRYCRLVWLDGGELAILQLVHQAGSKFIDAQEFKRRMEELEASPERKARFEKQMARLPEGRGGLALTLGGLAEDLVDYLLRGGNPAW